MAKTMFNNIDFMAWRKPAILMSSVLLLISIVSLVTLKLNVGIDFTGGSIIEVGYQQSVELEPSSSLNTLEEVSLLLPAGD